MMPKVFEYDGEFKSRGYAYGETYEIQVTLQQMPTNSKLRTGKGNRKWDSNHNQNLISCNKRNNYANIDCPQNNLPLINIDTLN